MVSDLRDTPGVIMVHFQHCVHYQYLYSLPFKHEILHFSLRRFIYYLFTSFSGSLALIHASCSASASIAFLIASMFVNLVFGTTATRLRVFRPQSFSICDSRLCILLGYCIAGCYEHRPRQRSWRAWHTVVICI
jgi:hypothetical protein